MDNLNSFKLDGNASENGKNESLEFQIYGKAPEDHNADASVSNSADEKNGKKTKDNDASSSDNAWGEEENISFVTPPSSLRRTYVPRFTEVSENYRMQNDPRPRPKTDTHNVKRSRGRDS